MAGPQLYKRTTRLRVIVDVDVPTQHARLTPHIQELVRTLAGAVQDANPTQWHLYGVTVLDADRIKHIAQWTGDGKRVVRVDADTGEVIP